MFKLKLNPINGANLNISYCTQHLIINTILIYKKILNNLYYLIK